MLYCSVLYLAVCVEGGAGAGGYLLAELGDHEIDTKEQHDDIGLDDKHTLLLHKIIFFSEGKIMPHNVQPFIFQPFHGTVSGKISLI